MSDTKSAATVLMELMVKLGDNPHYECTAQTGMQHQRMFEYRVTAHGGVVGVATARTKKEARQEAARAALAKLARLGHPVPPPYNTTYDGVSTSDVSRAKAASSGGGCDVLGGAEDAAQAALVTRNAVAMLRDLGEELHLGDAEYELVGDTGPPHLRHFTMRVSLRGHSRMATATTKKAARQLAAHQLYTYFRDNLHRLTSDYDEGKPLVRAHARAMDRYAEVREYARPQLTPCFADYHLGLKHQLGAKTSAAIVEQLQRIDLLENPVDTLMGLRKLMPGVAVKSMASRYCLELSPTAPPLVFNGAGPRQAAANVLRYLKITLADW